MMRLTWYDRLYVGEKAKKKRYHMIQALRNSKFADRAYVITPASNGHNILDIYPTAEFLSPYYREKELLVIGLAADYWEALEVAGKIVDEMYRKTGGFDLLSYLGEDEQTVQGTVEH